MTEAFSLRFLIEPAIRIQIHPILFFNLPAIRSNTIATLVQFDWKKMFLQDQIKRYPLNTELFLENPGTVWRQMHQDGPVVRSKLPIFGKVWFATKWQSVSDVLKDQSRFARDVRRVGRRGQLPFFLNWMVPRKFRLLSDHNILTSDNEDHRRLRFLVEEAFRRTQIEELVPYIESVSNELIETLTQAAGRNEGVVELASSYSRQLPLTVICEVLGLPHEDRPKFKNWFRAFAEIKSFGGLFRLIPGISKLLTYLQQQFEIVRNNPRPGLMSQLVQIEQEGDRLSRDELTSLVFVLLAAGHETTIHMINSAFRVMLNHPRACKSVMDDWNLLDAAVDEVLRFDSTVYVSKPRFAVENMDFHGVSIPRGDAIMAILGAANHDPDRFENPGNFDLTREKNYHMTFGSGPHVCLGMKLAKAETCVALRQFFERFPDLQLHKYQWQRRFGMMGVKSIHLKLG